MDMKVNTNLIRFERENRGWTQEQLASLTGLSLRTIQRIEKTGSASIESVTALASVLALGLAELRAGEAEPARKRALRLSLELPLRLVLAAFSGLLCALLFRSHLGLSPLEWFDYPIAGALFGAAVLCPYLRWGHAFVLRAVALIAASTLSYFCAVTFVLTSEEWFGLAWGLTAFAIASFIGVTIVLVAAKALIPLRVTAMFWLLGLVASLVGGAAMYAGFELLGDTLLNDAAGFCAWHMLACIAIHRGRASHDAQSGLLADFARTRARFSIVSGWLKLSQPALAGAFTKAGSSF